MGYFAHKVLVVTGELQQFENALRKAKEFFALNDRGLKVGMVSDVCKGLSNFKTFMIAPDGSKEDRETSDFFDEKMNQMIEYLKSEECVFSDKSSFNHWVLVEYGETGTRVLKSNCKNRLRKNKC